MENERKCTLDRANITDKLKQRVISPLDDGLTLRRKEINLNHLTLDIDDCLGFFERVRNEWYFDYSSVRVINLIILQKDLISLQPNIDYICFN